MALNGRIAFGNCDDLVHPKKKLRNLPFCKFKFLTFIVFVNQPNISTNSVPTEWGVVSIITFPLDSFLGQYIFQSKWSFLQDTINWIQINCSINKCLSDTCPACIGLAVFDSFWNWKCQFCNTSLARVAPLERVYTQIRKIMIKTQITRSKC